MCGSAKAKKKPEEGMNPEQLLFWVRAVGECDEE